MKNGRQKMENRDRKSNTKDFPLPIFRFLFVLLAVRNRGAEMQNIALFAENF